MVFVLLLININKLADMAELADALESGSSVLIDVGVRLPLSASF